MRLTLLFFTAVVLHSQVAISPWGKPQFFLSNGQPDANGFLNTYQAGTTTPLATYTDSSGISQNMTSIPLDAAGRPPSGIYLGSSSYKFILLDASSSTIWTQDGINIPGLAINSLTVTSGNSLTMNTGSTSSIGTNFLPDTDNARSLGAMGKAWANAYLNNVIAQSTFTNSFQVAVGPSNIAGAFNMTGHLVFQSGATVPQIDCTGLGAACQWNGSTTTNGNLALNPGAVSGNSSVVITAPLTNGQGLIIKLPASFASKALDVQDNNGVSLMYIGQTGIPHTPTIAPLADNTYNLGSAADRGFSNLRWLDVNTVGATIDGNLLFGSSATITPPTGTVLNGTTTCGGSTHVNSITLSQGLVTAIGCT